MNPAPAIHFDDLCVDFEGGRLFDHLNFSVSAGKCTCVLGPSGCGKSTLLRLVSGNPDISYTGSITFTPQRHRIGWMSQSDLLLPWMCLRDNVMLGARLRGQVDEDRRRRASLLLERAGLAAYEKALPATLSGGMRQRGALLRTLMEDCELLLMDEPFSALDALTRLKLQDLATEMTAGRTVLLVTHDPMEALRMGHEILVFTGVPAHIKRISELPGDIPRRPMSAEMAPYYEDLLNTLMNEGP